MKLNPKIYDLNYDQASMRQGFAEGLVEAGQADKNVVAITADLKESTRVDLFADQFPERFFDIGVAEQNLASVASGLAVMGKVPFMTTYAIFSPGRNWEQIRTTICYNNTNVKIVSTHAGLNVGPDGGSHQALEDIALMRVLPRMTVVVPCDALEAKKATVAMAKTNGPTYLRLPREKSAVITTEETPFEIGRANILIDEEKPTVAIIACGPVLHHAMMAAKKLKNISINAVVINSHTIKPLDEKTIIDVASRAGAVVTVEEHQIIGGLGSAVAAVLARHCPVPMEFVGVKDRFGQSGNAMELWEHYGLGIDDIFVAAKLVVQRKNQHG